MMQVSHFRNDSILSNSMKTYSIRIIYATLRKINYKSSQTKKNLHYTVLKLQ